MIEPMLLIFAPSAAIFGWAMVQMHREAKKQAGSARVKVDA